MRLDASLFSPEWGDLHKHGFADYVSKLVVENDFDESTMLLIQMPDEYNEKFVIKNDILANVLQPQNVLKLSVNATPGINGIYDLTYDKTAAPKSVWEIRQHINNMKTSNNYNPTDFFRRQNLSSFKPVVYLSDLGFSYVNEVYESSNDLPSGWNFHRLPNVLQNIYKGKDFSGITSTLSYISAVNTMTPLHREDFMLYAASYILPGGADKYSSCFNPFNHNAFSIDVDLLEELDFPYTVAVHKPGMVAVVLPAAYHQVYNTGISYAEAVNFVAHRWDVHVHRQKIFCCEEMISYYSIKQWDPLICHLFGDETDMKNAYKNFELLVSNAKKRISSTLSEKENPRQLSPDIFASETSDEDEIQTPSKRQRMSSSSNNIHQTVSNVNESSTSKNTTVGNQSSTSNESLSVIQQQIDKIFHHPENARQTRQQLKTQELQIEEELQRLAATQPVATAVVNVGAPIVLPQSPMPTTSNNDISKTLKILKRRQHVNKRDAASKKKHDEKRKGRQQAEGSRTEDQIRLRNNLKNKRKQVKTYAEALEDHNANLRQLSQEKYEEFQEKIVNLRQQINQLLRQRELRNGLTVIFKNQLMKRRELQGYVNFEIARDYINGQNPLAREMFKAAVTLMRPTDPGFWDQVTSSEEAWNECFGVDNDFRVPAHEYDAGV